ncbi:MAG TPA: CotH kinase family protein, partial [Verrucomicrobiae bacterium]
MKIYRIRYISVCLGFFAILLALNGAEAPPPADDLFAQPKVLQIKIEIPPASLDALKSDPRKYVRATLREGGVTLSDVGIRLKGNGAFPGLDKKPGLALKFNEYVSGQKFHIHSKLFLDNSHQDPSYLCEALGGEIFRSLKVPAPRATFARIELNGKDAGLYVVSEAVNREFLSQYFKKSKGNLYEGNNSDITDKLEKDAGDANKDQPDLKALAAAAKTQDPNQRLTKLSALLDVDRFIAFAAAETFTANHSGYCLARNNYRVYHDPVSNQLIFIPHGLNHLFSNPKAPIQPEWKGLIAKAVLDTPEGQRRYKDALTKLLASGGKPETLNARIADLAAKIQQAFGRDSNEAKSF